MSRLKWIDERCWSVAAALLLAVVVSTLSTVSAGEEKLPPPPPPPPIPGTPEVPGTPAEKPVVSSISGEDYVFDPNNRRDPFTFTKAVVSLEAVVQKQGEEEVPVSNRLPNEVVEEKRRLAEAKLNLAEMSLMELDPNSAVTQTDLGMDVFKGIDDISIYPELEVVKGRILRARKAGDQMRGRQSAERDFSAMNIKISGVMVHNRKNSQAIINSKIVRKGDLVAVTGDATDIMVDEILSERVVFLFRGYRMTLLVAEAGGK